MSSILGMVKFWKPIQQAQQLNMNIKNRDMYTGNPYYQIG